MASEKDLTGDCLLLKPKEASKSDLVSILFSSHLEEKNFCDTRGPESVSGLRRRWILFISVFVQKLLLYVKKPMAQIGYMLELLLNLVPSNGGYGGLLLNLLRGKVVWPDRSSATFRSLVGNIDLRVKLDQNINCNDSKYTGSLSIMAAKLSYENEAFAYTVVTDHWKMEFLGFYNFWNDYQEKYLTQAIIFQDTTSNPNIIVVAFRGTEPCDADQWITDVDLSWYDFEGVGKIHGGFMKDLGLQKIKGWPKEVQEGLDQKPFAYYTIREKLRDILKKNQNAKFIVTGHSLGGALAILFAAVLTFHEETLLLEKLEGVYTFGQPRVGDKKFGEFMKEKLRVYNVSYFRYVYCNDIVPRLPYDDKTSLFKHFGPCLYYNSFYGGQVLEEEPNKNYFSLLWFIPKNINAVWELMRSFIIPYAKGEDYKEGWFLRLFRVIGLVIPGLSAHGPQDYVNITRLGSSLSPHGHPDSIPQQDLKND